MDALHGRAGCDPKLVAEQDAQTVVDEQRLGRVAVPVERLHQDPVAGLAVRRQLDQPAAALLGLRQRRAAEAEPRLREALEAAHPDVVEAPPPLVQPRAVMTLEEGAAGHVIRDAGRAPGLRPLAIGDMGLRPVQRLERGLDVDERVPRQHELDLRSSAARAPGRRRAAASRAGRSAEDGGRAARPHRRRQSAARRGPSGAAG